MKSPAAIIFLGLLPSMAVIACGGKGAAGTPSGTLDCTVRALSVIPQNAAASHISSAPGNQQQFSAGPNMPMGCIPPPLPFDFATWSVSDPVNVSISNALDSTRGTATCLGATAGAVKVTASANDSRLAGGATVTGTASLTCN
jgi:hypothetical protein